MEILEQTFNLNSIDDVTTDDDHELHLQRFLLVKSYRNQVETTQFNSSYCVNTYPALVT
jgi:hypothetical protein